MSKKENWVWMPHAGHLIVGHYCRFHLNTYVGKYIVSTVGEYWPERQVREIHAKVHDPVWWNENRLLQGNNFDRAYMQRFGFEEIGLNRTYETMVFRAKRELDPRYMCCPWTMRDTENLDDAAYIDSVEAYRGHLAMCKIWAK